MKLSLRFIAFAKRPSDFLGFWTPVPVPVPELGGAGEAMVELEREREREREREHPTEIEMSIGLFDYCILVLDMRVVATRNGTF